MDLTSFDSGGGVEASADEHAPTACKEPRVSQPEVESTALEIKTGTYKHQWANRRAFYTMLNRAEVNVVGDGACYQHALEMSFICDYGLIVSVSMINHTLYCELDTRRAFYVGFHTVEGRDIATLSDEEKEEDMMHQAALYFADRQYRKSICDILVLAATHAFKVNIGIFTQTFRNYISFVLHKVPGGTKTIYLQLHREHYKSIIKKDIHTIACTPTSPSYKYLLTIPGFSSLAPMQETQVMQPPEESSGSSWKSPTPSKESKETNAEEPILHEPVCTDTKATRSKFPLHYYHGMTPTPVKNLPTDLDGFKWYVLDVPEDQDWRELQKDRRNFTMCTSKVTKSLQQEVIQKTGWCQGSTYCANESCEFYYFSAKKNVHHWERSRGLQGASNCFTCGSKGKVQPCTGRKLTQYNKVTRKLHVYHINKHTCSLKINKAQMDDYLEELIAAHPGLTVSELQELHVTQALRQKDLCGAYDRSNIVSDTARMRYLTQKARRSGQDTGRSQSIEAMIDHQKFMAEGDKYMLYKFNLEGMSAELPNFAFKTSRASLQLALMMNCDRKTSNPMAQELAFFDGQHSRVKGFITLALYTTLGASRSVVCLARMEATSESTLNVALFFYYFNQCLKEFSNNEDAYFNPVGICTDMGGGIMNGIAQAFSHKYYTDKVVGCQQHYMQNMREHSASIPSSQARHQFMELAKAAIKATNEVQYDRIFEQLTKFASMYPDLLVKVQWWHARKFQNVDVFRGIHFRKTNLAEAGHSSYTKKHGPMWLVEACIADTAKFMLQESTIDNFISGKIKSTGQAANQKALELRNKELQRSSVRGFRSAVEAFQETQAHGGNPGDEDCVEVDSYLPNEKEGFKPKKTLKKVPRSQKKKPSIPQVLQEAKRLRQKKKTAGDVLLKSMEVDNFLQDVRAGTQQNQRAMEFWKVSDAFESSADEEIELQPLRKRVRSRLQQEEASSEEEEDGTVILQVSQEGRKASKTPVKKKGKKGGRAAVPKENTKKRPNAQNYQFLTRAHVKNAASFPLEVPCEENPPYLVFLVYKSIKKCQGCRAPIDNPAAPPDNLVFTRLAHRPYYSKNGFQDKISPVYFHCSFECLKNFDSKIKPNHMTMEPEDFCKLLPSHLRKLALDEMLVFIQASVKAALSGECFTLVIRLLL